MRKYGHIGNLSKINATEQQGNKMSTAEEVRQAAHKFRQAKIEYEYHKRQVRHHLSCLAACISKVVNTEHEYCNVLEASGEPDPQDERSRIMRLLISEGGRDGRIYTEADAAMLQQRVIERKNKEMQKIYLRRYLEKKRAQK